MDIKNLFSIKTKNALFCIKINEDRLQGYSFINNNHRNIILPPLHNIDVSAFNNRYLFHTIGTDDFGEPALLIQNSDGSLSSRFEFDQEITFEDILDPFPHSKNKSSQMGLRFIDRRNKIYFDVFYAGFDDCNVVACHTKIINFGNEKINLLKIPSLEFNFEENNMIFSHFDGRWAQERHRFDESVESGLLVNQSLCGSSSADHSPFTLVKGKNMVYGFNLIYSGNHKTSFECNSTERSRIIIGINNTLFNYPLEAGESFTSPEAVMSFGKDENDMMQNMHVFVQNHIIRKEFSKVSRPVLFNNWEGTYFNFDRQKVLDMAQESKKMGGELFVLDDGWFGHRNDDTSSLGDWYPNMNKCGDLSSLSDEIKALGLKFGIWIEPEMISEDSDLYRQHPDYALVIDGQEPFRHRNQLTLNLVKPEVQKFVIESVSNILNITHADYIKWDYNRNITDVLSGTHLHEYICSLYEIMATIINKFPDVLFEGCAAGGSRFDLGILYFFPQIWTSDNTDPRTRIEIQDSTLLFSPPSTMGCHVSKSPNAFTERTSSLEDRFNVAIEGNLGYELDPCSLSTKEKEEIKKQISWYKSYRDILLYGITYRLQNNYGFVRFSKDHKRGVVCIYLMNDKLFSIKLSGFSSRKFYVFNNYKISGYELNKKGLPYKILKFNNKASEYSTNIKTIRLEFVELE